MTVELKGARVFYLTAGGLHDRRYLSALAGAGCEILYVHLLEGMNKHAPAGVKTISLGYRPVCGDGLSVRFERMARKLPLVPRVNRLLMDFQPDILHAGWIPTVGFWGALTGFHPFFLHSFGSDLRTRAGKSGWIRQVARYTLRRADAVTCDNRQTYDLITAEYGVSPSHVHCFPFGVDLDLFRPDPGLRDRVRRSLGWASNRILIHTRALEPLYDPFTFLKAFGELRRRLPDARALLAGSGTLLRSLESRAEEWGLESDVRFLGDVPQEDLVGYLNAADVLVSCPLDDGASNSVLEAMACALPVVVSDLPAMREWVEIGRAGFLVQPGDPRGFAGALSSVLESPGAREEMERRGRERVLERADRRRNRERFLEIYRCLLLAGPIRDGRGRKTVGRNRADAGLPRTVSSLSPAGGLLA